MMNAPIKKTVVFSHGKESGPWGIKITRLAGVAQPGITASRNAATAATSIKPEKGIVFVGHRVVGFVA